MKVCVCFCSLDVHMINIYSVSCIDAWGLVLRDIDVVFVCVVQASVTSGGFTRVMKLRKADHYHA